MANPIHPRSLPSPFDVDRRDFLKAGTLTVAAGLFFRKPARLSGQTTALQKPEKPKTNIDEAMAAGRTKLSLPGPFPGRVVEIHNPQAMVNDKPVPETVNAMFLQGLTALFGVSSRKSFKLLFDKKDVVGIKVNPVGPGLISTRLELVDAVIDWLGDNGVKPGRIVIWDRFDYMLFDAGFTSERYPGIGIEGLQTMDESAAEGKTEDNSRWLDKDGNHVSAANFDMNVFYWADVEGPKDLPYLNQHVFNGKHSYFGKLVTQKLTKIINIPVFKNTGNGVSMATKNLGYGAVCNTNRLHRPLFFDVCTEVLAFPAIRDKLVLNITDGLRAQYDGGPGPNAAFAYPYNRLFLATDPFALDMVCTRLMVEKRKSMGVTVNEHPMFTDYLRYAQRLGLGLADPEKITHVQS